MSRRWVAAGLGVASLLGSQVLESVPSSRSDGRPTTITVAGTD